MKKVLTFLFLLAVAVAAAALVVPEAAAQAFALPVAEGLLYQVPIGVLAVGVILQGTETTLDLASFNEMGVNLIAKLVRFRQLLEQGIAEQRFTTSNEQAFIAAARVADDLLSTEEKLDISIGGLEQFLATAPAPPLNNNAPEGDEQV